MLHHVVMFKLSDPSQSDEAVQRLRNMMGKIPALLSVRAGRDSNRGETAFDIVLITAHEDEDGLAAYVADPAHQKVLQWLRPRITERAVVDCVDLT